MPKGGGGFAGKPAKTSDSSNYGKVVSAAARAKPRPAKSKGALKSAKRNSRAYGKGRA